MGSTSTHLWVQVAKVVPIIGDSSPARKKNLLQIQEAPSTASVGIAFALEAHWCATASLRAGGVPNILPHTSLDATGQWWILRLRFQRWGDSYDSVSMKWTAAQLDDREGNNQRRDDMTTTKLKWHESGV